MFVIYYNHATRCVTNWDVTHSATEYVEKLQNVCKFLTVTQKIWIGSESREITMEVFKAHRQLAEEMTELENSVGTLVCPLKLKLGRFLEMFWAIWKSLPPVLLNEFFISELAFVCRQFAT